VAQCARSASESRCASASSTRARRDRCRERFAAQSARGCPPGGARSGRGNQVGHRFVGTVHPTASMPARKSSSLRGASSQFNSTSSAAPLAGLPSATAAPLGDSVVVAVEPTATNASETAGVRRWHQGAKALANHVCFLVAGEHLQTEHADSVVATAVADGARRARSRSGFRIDKHLDEVEERVGCVRHARGLARSGPRSSAARIDGAAEHGLRVGHTACRGGRPTDRRVRWRSRSTDGDLGAAARDHLYPRREGGSKARTRNGTRSVPPADSAISARPWPTSAPRLSSVARAWMACDTSGVARCAGKGPPALLRVPAASARNAPPTGLCSRRRG